MIHFSFPAPGTDQMALADFNAMKTYLDANMGPNIQGYAITWTAPWRVNNCQSLTNALTRGLRDCASTKDTFNYPMLSTKPFTNAGIRPSMMLAGTSAQNVFNLIDRGVLSDHTLPAGDGFFVRTTISPFRPVSGFSNPPFLPGTIAPTASI